MFGPLTCAEGTSALNFKGKELQVFFFDQNIIFSEAVGKKTQFSNPVYIYKAHIQVCSSIFITYLLSLLCSAFLTSNILLSYAIKHSKSFS